MVTLRFGDVVPIFGRVKSGGWPLWDHASDLVRRTRSGSDDRVRHGTKPIVILPPCFDQDSYIGDRNEVVDIQALVAQATVKTLDKCVLYRLSGPDEVELDAMPVYPFVERLKM